MALSTETKTGMFFLLGLAILAALTVQVSDVGALVRKTYTLRTFFRHASELGVGDRVAIAGVTVGEVVEIRLHDEEIEVLASIDKRYTVRKGATARVAWSGLLGGRYLDVSFGPRGNPDMEDGDELTGEESIDVSLLIRRLDDAADRIKSLFTGKTADMIEEIGPQLKQLIQSLAAISIDIKEQKGTIGKLIASDEMYVKMKKIADDVAAAGARVNRILDKNEQGINEVVEELSKAAPELNKAVQSVQRLATKFEKSQGTIPKLFEDETVYKDLKEAVASIKGFGKQLEEGKGLLTTLTRDADAARDFRETLKSARALAQRLEKGDSTIAKLMREREMYDELKKLLGDARKSLDEARAAIRNMSEQVPVGAFGGLLVNALQ